MPVSRTLAAALLLVMVIGSRSFADGTIYGCANSRGRVHFIMTSPPMCRATETPLSWNQVGPQGPPGPQGPGLVFKDANGAVLGPFAVLPPYQYEYAVRFPNATAVRFQMSAGNFVDDLSLWYTSVDCSGQALADVGNPGSAFRLGEVHNNVLHFGAGLATVQAIASRLIAPDTPCTCVGCIIVPPDACCEPSPTPFSALAAPDATEDLSNFVPPFHVEGP